MWAQIVASCRTLSSRWCLDGLGCDGRRLVRTAIGSADASIRLSLR